MYAKSDFHDGVILIIFSAHGAAVAGLPVTQRPRGLVFILEPLPKDTTPSSPTNDEAVRLVSRLIQGQQDNQIFTIDLNIVIKNQIPVNEDIQRQLLGGQWTSEQASKLSYNVKQKCICIASGRSFKVFVDGTTVVSYTDAINRAHESAAETYNRQGWSDGELLVQFGERALLDRSRRGIWHFPEHHVLTHKPEEMIKLALESFLREHLTGFESVAQEYHLENEGRVDLFIILADRTKYIVEIKWIGRSILKNMQANLKTLYALCSGLNGSVNTFSC